MTTAQRKNVSVPSDLHGYAIVSQIDNWLIYKDLDIKFAGTRIELHVDELKIWPHAAAEDI